MGSEEPNSAHLSWTPPIWKGLSGDESGLGCAPFNTLILLWDRAGTHTRSLRPLKPCLCTCPVGDGLLQGPKTHQVQKGLIVKQGSLSYPYYRPLNFFLYFRSPTSWASYFRPRGPGDLENPGLEVKCCMKRACRGDGEVLPESATGAPQSLSRRLQGLLLSVFLHRYGTHPHSPADLIRPRPTWSI